MTVSRSSSGTKTADGTEQTLASPTAPGLYWLLVDLSVMANGDTVEFRAKVPVLNGGTNRVVAGGYAPYSNVQSADSMIAVFGPLPVVDASTFTLKQTAGSNKSYLWAIIIEDNKVDLVSILGTALTETAGQIAAAFRQFFNIASPTSTMNLITAVTNLTNAPTAGDLTATMKASVNTEADTALADAGVTTTVTGRIDVATSSRLATGSYTAPPSAATIATAVWAALTSALTTTGSIGKLIVDYLDAAITSRASQDSADDIAEDAADIWATTAGDAEADDTENPTEIVYSDRDGDPRITHSLTGTTRTRS